MVGFVRSRSAGKAISEEVLNDIRELKGSLFNAFGEMTSAESKLLLLGEEHCQELLRDYGEFVTNFKAESSIHNENLTETNLNDYRRTILEKRKALFTCLSSQYIR